MVSLLIEKFLEDLSGRYARPYFRSIHDLFAAVVRNNREAAADARATLETVVVETTGVGQVLGARLLLAKAARLIADDRERLRQDRHGLIAFADKVAQTLLPSVTFEEAVQDMLDRTPVTLRRAAERTAAKISELYAQRRAVAFVRSAEASVTREAQDFIARALRQGIPEGEAGRFLAMSVEEVRKRSQAWSEGYARMAFRTNVNTAVTAGRFRQAQDPDIKQVIPAFAFDAVMDSDTRENHAKADTLIFSVDNPVWNKIAPPLGYNCRCQVREVSVPELKRRGRWKNGAPIESRLPPGAAPDPGFRHGGRPDLFFTG